MMKFGLLTAILDGWSFEEVVDIASQMGFKCLEVACWPAGKAERRYAGVSHIDCERVCQDDSYADYVKKLTSSKGLEISSLAFYPNTMDPDLEKREAAISHLKAVIRASAKLGVNMVTTFIGKDQHKTFEENIELFRQIWPDIIALAEQCGVKVAHRELPHALRRGSVARRTEPDVHPENLPAAVRDHPLPQFRPEFRPQPLRLAGAGLCEDHLRLLRPHFPRPL